MKSKHDVRVQQSRRRFLADTALGAAGLGLGAAGMESAQARTKWEKMIKGLQTVTNRCIDCRLRRSRNSGCHRSAPIRRIRSGH